MIRNKFALFIILFGSLLWSLTMIKSGMCWDSDCVSGIGFWGPNGHDGIWHISLAKSLSKGTWEMPVFAGEQIKNYHVGFDLSLAALHKLTFIPVDTLYFQILPPIFALLIGYFVYKFVYEWTNSSSKAIWSLFFVYLGGSWGWLISFLRNSSFDGESMFWAQQSISTLINPPFALSLILIFSGLYLLTLDFHKRTTKHMVLVSFIFGVLVQVKVYAGILVLLGLFVSGFWRLIQRNGVDLVKVFTGSLIISILIFSPLSGELGNAVVFKPFWFLETMMTFSDRLNWPRYGDAMINYKLGNVWIKGIVAYIVALLIFWYGNLGSRIIKEFLIFKWLKNYRKLDSIQIFSIIVILAGIIIPTFFVQSGTPWNTIQFLYYSLVFSGIIAGIAMGEYLEKLDSANNDILKWFFSLLVIVTTVPTTFATLKYHYLPSRPPAKITTAELDALRFLQEQEQGVVLTQPFDLQKAEEALSNPPRPLFAYISTAYVSAMSGQKVFLEDEVNLEITGYPWKERRKLVEEFFINPGLEFLQDNNIKYVYVVKELGIPDIEMNKIYENQEVIIYSQ